MAGSGITQIDDAELLHTAGTGALEVAGDFRGTADRYASALHDGGRRLRGGDWSGQLGAAMAEASQVWREQTSMLVEQCRALGQQCQQSARAYRQAEEGNRQVFSYVDSPFG